MIPMVDIHTHILPAYDDGAADVYDTLEMLRIAADNGTRTIVATPHSNLPGKPARSCSEIKRIVSLLNQAAKKENINITVLSGMEIFATDDVAKKLKNGELLTVNDTKYPLIEFDFETDSFFVFRVLESVISEGYTPIIAHPERYRCIAENISLAYELYRMGAVIQINKGSVRGRFGNKAASAAATILNHRLAAVAASDAHNIFTKTSDLSEFAIFLDMNFGSGCSSLLLNENPQRIISGKDVHWQSPIPFR